MRIFKRIGSFGKMRVKFITLGCKTNFYESQAMAKMFEDAGYETVEKGTADIYVINTCTVTGVGAQKSRQHIRRAKKENPSAVIAVTGCYSQTEPEAVAAIAEVDVMVGTSGRGRIVDLVEKALSGKRIIEHTDIMKERTFEELAPTSHQSRIRANLKIEDGCNNFCTYCIIPYARGPVRSRDLEKIVGEAKLLADNGYLEIVLTGIHIGSYGKDLESGIGLIDVVEAVCAVDGIERVRLGSIEPVIITPDFVARAKRLKKLCPQFHLSLQSGCTETLKRMNRHYTAEEYAEAVDLIRADIKDASITTDLMVGFPGETEEEFQSSYEFCKKIGFMQMHVFKYSVRKGTRAEKMSGQIPEEIKEERSRKMLELAENMKREFYAGYVGKEAEVLVETKMKNGKYHATTPNYMDIFIDAESLPEGKIIKYTVK